jgi:hypothetical protein
MADESKPTWVNWLAITTIIFSACATLSTFKGGGFSTKSILAQTNASNMWAYFQSKSVKQHAYELQKDVLELQLIAIQDDAQAKAYKSTIEQYEKEIKRYDSEKAQAMNDAKAFEQSRADFQLKSASFGMAVVFLQVAIMFSALAALLKKKFIWVAGVAVGMIGLFYFFDGLWHIIT